MDISGVILIAVVCFAVVGLLFAFERFYLTITDELDEMLDGDCHDYQNKERE